MKDMTLTIIRTLHFGVLILLLASFSWQWATGPRGPFESTLYLIFSLVILAFLADAFPIFADVHRRKQFRIASNIIWILLFSAYAWGYSESPFVLLPGAWGVPRFVVAMLLTSGVSLRLSNRQAPASNHSACPGSIGRWTRLGLLLALAVATAAMVITHRNTEASIGVLQNVCSLVAFLAAGRLIVAQDRYGLGMGMLFAVGIPLISLAPTGI